MCMCFFQNVIENPAQVCGKMPDKTGCSLQNLDMIPHLKVYASFWAFWVNTYTTIFTDAVKPHRTHHNPVSWELRDQYSALLWISPAKEHGLASLHVLAKPFDALITVFLRTSF